MTGEKSCEIVTRTTIEGGERGKEGERGGGGRGAKREMGR